MFLQCDIATCPSRGNGCFLSVNLGGPVITGGGMPHDFWDMSQKVVQICPVLCLECSSSGPSHHTGRGPSGHISGSSQGLHWGPSQQPASVRRQMREQPSGDSSSHLHATLAAATWGRDQMLLLSPVQMHICQQNQCCHSRHKVSGWCATGNRKRYWCQFNGKVNSLRLYSPPVASSESDEVRANFIPSPFRGD